LAAKRPPGPRAPSPSPCGARQPGGRQTTRLGVCGKARYFLAARLDAVDLEERVEAVRPLAALRAAVFRVVRLF
jgi:hypothetical protein